jgi:hypothetical protein
MDRLPEESQGLPFQKRLQRGIQAEKIIKEFLERRGWTLTRRGLGTGSDSILHYDEAKNDGKRFEPDYRMVKVHPSFGKLEVDAEFKGTWKGELWINKYQFEKIAPDILIVVVDFRTHNIYCAFKKNLENAPYKEVQRPGYKGDKSRTVLVFDFKYLSPAERSL